MQDFNHLEALWTAHSVDLKISANEMLKQVKKDVNHIKTKSILNICGMIGSFLAIALIWLFIPAQFLTTHIGISIILITIGIYSAILYKHHRMISKTDFTANPNEYLNTLKSYQLMRLKLYNQTYWLYTIFLSLGLFFYFIEIFEYYNTIQKIGIIAALSLWIIFCSTFLRKKIMQREKEKINLLIEKFERIGKQFDN